MRLAINIDHVATLRQARGGTEPDPLEAARICEAAGVDGIVCHLREDRRHIQDRDVYRLREIVTTKLDLEMAATGEIIGIALDVKPDFVTLVPERREELTTEGGLNVAGQREYLHDVVQRFHEHGIPVSMFVDPEPEQIEASKEVLADMIEIHTGDYANAAAAPARERELVRIRTAAVQAKRLGLGVNGGHGLHYENVAAIVAVAEIDELSIGHAIISRSIISGLGTAVKEMLRLVKAGR
jgi:pyridoxine 5-phosphate synthase